jgi:hypothetical protein
MMKLALLASLVLGATTASASPAHHHWWWVGEAVAGDPEITALGVLYADGTKQMVHLSPGYLEQGPRDIVVNRGLRRIHAIMVYEDPASPGRFAIYGR